VLLDLLLL